MCNFMILIFSRARSSGLTNLSNLTNPSVPEYRGACVSKRSDFSSAAVRENCSTSKRWRRPAISPDSSNALQPTAFAQGRAVACDLVGNAVQDSTASNARSHPYQSALDSITTERPHRLDITRLTGGHSLTIA